MSDDLIATVWDRASLDATLPDQAKWLVVSALDGADSLEDAIGSPPPETSLADHPTAAPSPEATDEAAEANSPTPAFLSRISVTGFRGIGPTSTLTLEPCPGLTVIAGRNGCGKSSFAEALEVALTRRSYRWTKRSAVWSETWRNLHAPDPTSIVVELAEEGAGATVVAAEWDQDAALDEVKIWTQRPRSKRGSLADLGWDRDLDLFRPFLSYDELGAVFAEPSKLHDALAGILGLDRLADATKLLGEALKRRSAATSQATAINRDLVRELATSDDARAPLAIRALRSRPPDLESAAALATGTSTASPKTAALSALTQLTPPPLDAWKAARTSHETAIDQHREALRAAAAAGQASVHLLRSAIEHAETHGPVSCPVCGQGTLDAEWLRGARETVDKAGVFAAATDEAQAHLIRTADGLRQAAGTVPACLAAAEPLVQETPLKPQVEVAWQRFLTAAADPSSSLTDVERLHSELTDAVTSLVPQAQAALAAHEDQWRPHAAKLAEWLVFARQAAATADVVASLKAAEKWLKANLNDLRNARLTPLAQRARHIWSTLRQESNVELDGLTLEGSATRRRVELTATVDGHDAQAFGVMSQGELHALALAIFLPRATAENSPFGFLVIDDPVQAMDPAKVDGLVPRVVSCLTLVGLGRWGYGESSCSGVDAA